MDFGYKTLLALTLATAACWRAKAQRSDTEYKVDSVENIDPHAQNNSRMVVTDMPQTNNPQFDAEQQQTLKNLREVWNLQFPGIKISDHELLYMVATNNLHSAQDVTQDTLQIEEAPTVENPDSTILQSIQRQFTEIAPEAMRFIAHFENIKMNAYWDRVARKWTIGFGNITRPDGKPVRRGDRIKDEAELMLYFNDYFLEKVAPVIAKYFPNWSELSKDQKIATCDLFWNAGSGVLVNQKEYDTTFQNMTEEQRYEVAQKLQNKNESITYNGQKFSLTDISEWRNLDVSVRTSLQLLYPNSHIVKGDAVNHSYNEKWQVLNEQQREDVLQLMITSKLIPNLTLSSSLNVSQFQSTWNPSLVNDSTVRYRGFLTEQHYTASEVPSWYKLKNTQQEQVGKLLAVANGAVVFNGHTLTSKEIPVSYFMNKNDRETVRQSLGSDDLLVRKRTDNKRKPVLSNLAYELNLYAVTKDPVAQERVATRMASFTRSRGRVVSALQKRANIRAQVFLGNIQLNGEGDNSLNLETIKIGAGYSVKISDLNDGKAICDSINDCVSGKTYQDTLNAQLSSTPRRTNQANRSRVRTAQRTQTRTNMARSGARGR